MRTKHILWKLNQLVSFLKHDCLNRKAVIKALPHQGSQAHRNCNRGNLRRLRREVNYSPQARGVKDFGINRCKVLVTVEVSQFDKFAASEPGSPNRDKASRNVDELNPGMRPRACPDLPEDRSLHHRDLRKRLLHHAKANGQITSTRKGIVICEIEE
jgi:hypothetical protein